MHRHLVIVDLAVGSAVVVVAGFLVGVNVADVADSSVRLALSVMGVGLVVVVVVVVVVGVMIVGMVVSAVAPGVGDAGVFVCFLAISAFVATWRTLVTVRFTVRPN